MGLTPSYSTLRSELSACHASTVILYWR